MKLGLFGWLDKRLVQREEDQDFIKEKLINSNYACPWQILSLHWLFMYWILFKLSWELVNITVFSACSFEPGVLPEPETLEGLSAGFTWFDLVKSLATFDTPFLLYAKLQASIGKRASGCEYDPETNRLNSVSSGEWQ